MSARWSTSIPGTVSRPKGELRDVDRVPGDDDEGGWGIDTVPLTDDSSSTPWEREVLPVES